MIPITTSLCLNENTVLEIGKFTVLWNIFECTKCANNCSEQKLITIGENCQTSEPWQYFAHILQKRATTQNCDIDSYVRYRLSLGNGSQHLDKIIRFIDSDGTTELCGGLLAIFRIRNNMFHGLKEYKDLDNQIQLFDAMNRLLEHLL